MKRLLLIPLILITLTIPFTSCSKINDLLPKALASDTQEIVEQVEADTDDVFAEIQHNIDLVAGLKYKVEQDRINGQPLSLDNTIKDLQTITYSYERLSNQHEAIRKGLYRKIAGIEDMCSQVNQEIALLKQRRTNYAEQLRKVSDPNPDIVSTRQDSLSQAIKYVDAQILLWTEFNNIEVDIIAEMDNIQKAVDSFLSMIDSSAILFREGLNLLVLQRDINEALSLFTRDVPRMEQLTDDMEKSWSNLDYLINTLTSITARDI